MKKFIQFIALPILLGFQVFAQSKEIKETPNYNGIWIFDKIETATGNAALISSMEKYENYVLVISFANNEFKIKRSYTFKGASVTYESTLFTDARGEKNSVPLTRSYSVEQTSKTKIKKNKIISEYAYKDEINGGKETFSGIEKYTLSKDGNKLTFENIQTFGGFDSSLIPDDFSKVKYVFRRKD